MPYTGDTTIVYTVGGYPGDSDLPVSGSVRLSEWYDLPSSGEPISASSVRSRGVIPLAGSTLVKYRVLERPSVTLAVTPVVDAFVSSSEPTLNYGDTNDLIVGRYDETITRSAIKFDLSALPVLPRKYVISAKLLLTVRIRGPVSIRACEIISPWEENGELGITWANQPAVNPYPLDEQAAAEEVLLDITPLFLKWYLGTSPNHGVMLFSSDENAQAHVVSCSKEWPRAAQRPQLLFTHFSYDLAIDSRDLPSRGNVVGLVSELPSSGTIRAQQVAAFLPSSGKVSVLVVWSTLPAAGTVTRPSNLVTWGNVRLPPRAGDLTGKGNVSQPVLPSSGTPRAYGQADLTSDGGVYARDDFQSAGQVRVVAWAELPTEGYVANAPNEVPSSGVVDGYYHDLAGAGSVKAPGDSDLASVGEILRGSGDLPSSGHVTGGTVDQVTSATLQSSGILQFGADFWGRGQVRVADHLSSQGLVAAYGEHDEPSSGWPRVRDASDLLSFGRCKAFHRDLPSRGHIGPWVYEWTITVKLWPPEGRSVR